jgi:dTDP-4-dehydrorhamnose 3,5-epimerase-like enzyme
VLDIIAVDIRPKSQLLVNGSFMSWMGRAIKMVYIPGGFAHGFALRTASSYKCTQWI